MIVPVFKPSINRKDMDSVLTCMVSDDIGPGSISNQFVKAVAEYLGVPGGMAFRDQSGALSLALEGLNLDSGRNVLMSPLSPGYYIHLLQRCGLQPVYADVDPSTGCMTAEAVENALAAHNPAAALVWHPLGAVPDTAQLYEAGIPVIEDISTSFGADGTGGKVGAAAKYLVITLEEDGIITTAGGSLFFSSIRTFFSEFKKQIADTARTSNMTNLNAALGIVQIRQVEGFLNKRREIREIFLKSVMKTRHRAIPAVESTDMVPYGFPVVLKSGVQNVVRYAAKHGVRAIPAFDGCALARYAPEDADCPNAEALRLRCVLFPLYPRLSGQNVQLIAKVLSTLP